MTPTNGRLDVTQKPRIDDWTSGINTKKAWYHGNHKIINNNHRVITGKYRESHVITDNHRVITCNHR